MQTLAEFQIYSLVYIYIYTNFVILLSYKMEQIIMHP